MIRNRQARWPDQIPPETSSERRIVSVNVVIRQLFTLMLGWLLQQPGGPTHRCRTRLPGGEFSP